MKSWSGWAHTFRAPRDDSVIVSTLHLTDNIVQEKNDVETSAVLAGDEKVDDKNIDGNEEERGTEHGTSVVAGSRRPVGISVPEMSSVGWMVKRIFDAGRVHYLRQQMGLIAHQTVYCAGSLSPENVMLLASQK